MLRILTISMLSAFSVSMLTGKAYYRRVIVREEESFDYWSTVASYLILGLLEPVVWIIQKFR